MQYKNYNIDLYCSALNEDIGKINVLYNNLESTYGEIINNSDISFNWEGSVKDTFSVKIDNFKSGYNDLYKEKSNLKSISDLMERLKKKLLEYKGIETQLQQSYRKNIRRKSIKINRNRSRRNGQIKSSKELNNKFNKHK